MGGHLTQRENIDAGLFDSLHSKHGFDGRFFSSVAVTNEKEPIL